MAAFVGMFVLAGSAFAYSFPSTNQLNKDKQTPGYIGQNTPYVELVEAGVGKVKLNFVGSYVGGHYFEYRIDGVLVTSGDPHMILIGEYEYPGVWVIANTTVQREINSSSYVEVRLALGAENDWYFDWTRFDVLPFVRSAEITSPLSGAEVSGIVSFDATLTDKDGDDSVQWAVRPGTCASGATAVWSNVDGRNDPYDWDHVNFHTIADTSSWLAGNYCFVFNPSESAGDTAIRETREFVVLDLDLDDDGVLNEDDLCPNTEADGDWDVSWGTNRWQVQDDFSWYQNKPGKKGANTPTPGHGIDYTYGCNGHQILTMLKEELGDVMNGHWKFGLSSSVLDEFHWDMIDGQLDGIYLVDEVDVPGTSAAGITTAYTTVDGINYKLEATGTYKFANWGEYGIADAKFNYRDAAHGGPAWVDGSTWSAPYQYYLQVSTSGSGIGWIEDFNAPHLYTASFAGDGNPIHFQILDDVYGDNSGSIHVKVFADL